MKHTQNRNAFSKVPYGLDWIFQRFMKNTLKTKNAQHFDGSERLIHLHEKLQIIFANIRV